MPVWAIVLIVVVVIIVMFCLFKGGREMMVAFFELLGELVEALVKIFD
jgi:hypothetical protein